MRLYVCPSRSTKIGIYWKLKVRLGQEFNIRHFSDIFTRFEKRITWGVPIIKKNANMSTINDSNEGKLIIIYTLILEYNITIMYIILKCTLNRDLMVDDVHEQLDFTIYILTTLYEITINEYFV